MFSHSVFAVDLNTNYNALSKVTMDVFNHPASERPGMIADAYDKLFLESSEGDLSKLTDEELDLLQRAAHIVVGNTLDPKYARYMRASYDELAKRSALTDPQKQAMVEVLAMVRQMDAARRLSEKSPELGIELPKTIEVVPEPHDPTIWVASASDKSLVRKPVKLVGTRIIVASHPLCSFSESALKQLEADPQLSRVFSEKSLWVLPQTATLNVDQLLGWEKKHPAFNMAYMYDQHEWPMLDEWGTPIFYFLKDDKVVSKVVGWPPEGRKAQILESLKLIE